MTGPRAVIARRLPGLWRHPFVTITWAISFVLITLGERLHDVSLGQWGLLFGIGAGVSTIVVALHRFMGRFTQIVALFAEDVHLDSPRTLRAVDSRFPTSPVAQQVRDDGSPRHALHSVR